METSYDPLLEGWEGWQGLEEYNITNLNWTYVDYPEIPNEFDHLSQIIVAMHKVYIWILFVVGVPGNLLTALAYLGMRADRPATLYIVFHAVYNCLALTTKLVSHQLAQHGVFFGQVGCVLEFLPPTLHVLANLTLVSAVVERYIHVCKPSRHERMFSRRYTKISLVASAAVVTSFYFAIFVSMRRAILGQCLTPEDYLLAWSIFLQWINSSLLVYIPLTIFPIMTYRILRAFARQRKQRLNNPKPDIPLGPSSNINPDISSGASSNIKPDISSGASSNTKADISPYTTADITLEPSSFTKADISSGSPNLPEDQHERKITHSILLICCLVCVLSLPACVFYMFPPAQDNLTLLKLSLFDQIQFVCLESALVVNFFVYLVFSQRFREQIRLMLTCKFSLKRRPDVTESPSVEMT